ncbi:MAG TPA: WD40 repeat domain-containing protein, partial [Ktedonobacteraceae bacterium]|nr:WD40 repeat domain-containing protein [Ktedonobacteraceae bacterium]
QAQTQQKLAEMQTLDANSRALAADSAFALSQDALDRALLLSVWAWQTDPTPEARDSLLSALEKNPQIISILHNRSGTIEITGIVFHSNGHTFIATDGQQLYTGDTITRQISPLPLDDQLTIGGIALSPDGQTLATSSAEGVWLRSTQKSVKPSNLAGKVPGLSSNIVQNTPIAFTSDGQLVESARCSQYSPTDDTVCIKTQISIFNVQSKQPVGSPYAIPGDANTAAFSLDGKILASTSGTNIQLWNVATGNPLPSPITGITSPVTSMAFSPGDQTLVTGSQDGSVRLWDVMSGRLISDSFIGHKDAITGLAFSPNGTSLAASSRDKTVLVWDVSSGLLLDTLNGDSQEKGSVAFSPDGTTLASGSMDGTILLWNIAAESAIARSLVDTDILWSPVFTPDGTQVFTGNSKGQIILQNVKTGQPFDVLKTDKYPLLQPKDQISADLHTMQSLALSGDGSILASGRLDGTIVLWNMHTRTSFAHFMYPTLLFKVSLSANGKILAAVGSGDKIILWNVTNGTKISSIPYDQGQLQRIPPVALSPDGKVLAVGTCVKGNTGICVRGLVQLWDVSTGKLKQSLSGHSFSVSSVAFSPDGHILASGSQDGILLWDVLTGKPAGNGQMLSIPADSNDYYSNLVFSSNGNMLASSSPLGDNFSFVLWNVAPGEPLGPLTHAIEVNASTQGSIAFAPNGQQLATVSVTQADGLGIFLLWDITVKSWEAKACFIANRDLNPEEWRQFGTGGTTRRVC